MTSWTVLPALPLRDSSPSGSSSVISLSEVSYRTYNIPGLCLSITDEINTLFAAYVGVATVGASMWWFLLYEDGPQITYYQLVSFRFNEIEIIISEHAPKRFQ